MKKGLLLLMSTLIALSAIGCGKADQASSTPHDDKGAATTAPPKVAGGGAGKAPAPSPGPK